MCGCCCVGGREKVRVLISSGGTHRLGVVDRDLWMQVLFAETPSRQVRAISEP